MVDEDLHQIARIGVVLVVHRIHLRAAAAAVGAPEDRRVGVRLAVQAQPLVVQALVEGHDGKDGAAFVPQAHEIEPEVEIQPAELHEPQRFVRARRGERPRHVPTVGINDGRQHVGERQVVLASRRNDRPPPSHHIFPRSDFAAVEIHRQLRHVVAACVLAAGRLDRRQHGFRGHFGAQIFTPCFRQSHRRPTADPRTRANVRTPFDEPLDDFEHIRAVEMRRQVQRRPADGSRGGVYVRAVFKEHVHRSEPRPVGAAQQCVVQRRPADFVSGIHLGAAFDQQHHQFRPLVPGRVAEEEVQDVYMAKLRGDVQRRPSSGIFRYQVRSEIEQGRCNACGASTRRHVQGRCARVGARIAYAVAAENGLRLDSSRVDVCSGRDEHLDRSHYAGVFSIRQRRHARRHGDVRSQM